MSKKVIEIEADKLSDEVYEELSEEDILDEKTIRTHSENVWLDEIGTGESSKTGIFEHTKKILSKWHNHFTNYKTVFVDIESVRRSEDDSVLLEVSNDRLSGSVCFDPDSTELANIMEFHEVESPRELEGCSLPILRSSIQGDE